MMLQRLQHTAAVLACACMLGTPALAAPAAGQRVTPTDVALTDGGALLGQVVDAQGAPLAAAPVSIQSQGREVAQATSNESGEFAVNGLKGGVYQIAAPGHQGVYRVWAPRTAPPAANNGVLIVASGDLLRGQCAPGPFGAMVGWVSAHPIMTAGIIATAIAVPLALNDDDSGS